MKLKKDFAPGTWALTALLGAAIGIVSAPVTHAQELSASSLPAISNPPEIGNPSAKSNSSAPPVVSAAGAMREAYQELGSGKWDDAIDKVNAVINGDPRNAQAYLLRGSVYAQQKLWDKADQDYRTALALEPQSAVVRFDLAELKFMQKRYDEARSGFQDLETNKVLGDFATYKALLCDLFGAHEAAAAKDLDAINQVGGNPSYYFGNAAWDLVHNKPEAAAEWLKSASRIYADSPNKLADYAASLKTLGYLPLHLSSTQ